MHEGFGKLEDGAGGLEIRKMGAWEEGEGVIWCEGRVGEFGAVAGDEGEKLAFEGFGNGVGEDVFAG